MPARFNNLKTAGLLWRNSLSISAAGLSQERGKEGTLMTLNPWPSNDIALGTVVLEMLCNQEEMKNLLPDLHYKKESF